MINCKAEELIMNRWMADLTGGLNLLETARKESDVDIRSELLGKAKELISNPWGEINGVLESETDTD